MTLPLVDRPGSAPRRGRRWRRVGLRVAAGYAAACVLAQVASVGIVAAARALAGDPREDAVAGIANLRRVDERVWAGGQPDEAAYRELAERGVTLVVDLRTGSPDDAREDDPALLRSLGMAYRSLPVSDGHAPNAELARTFFEVARAAEGDVFVHCGGGVGRTSALSAAYRAYAGVRPSFPHHAAVGPATLAQWWFVLTARPGDVSSVNPVVRRVSEALDAPRRLLSRARGAL